MVFEGDLKTETAVVGKRTALVNNHNAQEAQALTLVPALGSSPGVDTGSEQAFHCTNKYINLLTMTVLSAQPCSAKPGEHKISQSSQQPAELEYKECEESGNKNPGMKKLVGRDTGSNKSPQFERASQMLDDSFPGCHHCRPQASDH